MQKKTTISGLLNIDKPPDLTSHDVVFHIRRLLQPTTPPWRARLAPMGGYNLQPPKVGHTGTLDPFATGVLLVAVGQATRFIEYSHDWDKEYEATFVLGGTSDTDDVTGIIKKIENRNKENRTPTKAKIKNILKQFIGTTKQTPPDYSAVKVQGQKAYDLSRRGETPNLKPRLVTIHSIKLISYDYPSLRLRITCGTGTYIRALARDLGNVLGTGAYVSALRRTRIGRFTIKQAYRLDQMTVDNLSSSFHPTDTLVSHLPKVSINDSDIPEFVHGQPIKYNPSSIDIVPLNKPLAAYGSNKTFLGTAIFNSQGSLCPQKVLG